MRDELSKNVYKVADRIEKEFSSPELKLEPTGFIKLISNMQDYVVDSQVKSCLIAAVLITAMMFLLLRSWKLGLVSIVANFTPIVMGIGMMGFLGISLDPGTVMIATVAIGLVVDDTCHFLVRYRNSKNGWPVDGTSDRNDHVVCRAAHCVYQSHPDCRFLFAGIGKLQSDGLFRINHGGHDLLCLDCRIIHFSGTVEIVRQIERIS